MDGHGGQPIASQPGLPGLPAFRFRPLSSVRIPRCLPVLGHRGFLRGLGLSSVFLLELPEPRLALQKTSWKRPFGRALGLIIVQSSYLSVVSTSVLSIW